MDQRFDARVSAYIAKLPEEQQKLAIKLREEVFASSPDALETFSYQLPAYGRKRIFLFFGFFKEHIGIYPPLRGDEELLQKAKPYMGPKGNLKIPLNDTIPWDLLRQVIQVQAQHIG